MSALVPRPKHVPMRRCLSCRLSRPQAELVRLALDGEGQWLLDPGRKASGRGAWLCRDKPECWSVKALKRTLKGQAERVAGEVESYFEAQQARAVETPGAQGRAGRVRVRIAKTEKQNSNATSGNGGPNV